MSIITGVYDRQNEWVVFEEGKIGGSHYPKDSDFGKELAKMIEESPWLLQKELPENIDDKAEFIRTERNRLLSTCDWTQVADSPVDREAWRIYRQALRDITKQPSFPVEIVWPSPPQK